MQNLSIVLQEYQEEFIDKSYEIVLENIGDHELKKYQDNKK